MSAIRSMVSLTIGFSIILSGWPAFADDIYRFKDENGVWHFSNINSDRRYRLYFHFDTHNEKPDVFITKHDSVIGDASERFGVKKSLIKAVIHAESGFDEDAVSDKGAQGLMQLMPKTAEQLEVEDPYDAQDNIFGGAKYLSYLLERYNNNLKKALAAYNAGPENVEKYNGIPPFPETEKFIKRVLDYKSQYEKEGK
jgi:soluble lytic murein transglycosylase-like protein